MVDDSEGIGITFLIGFGTVREFGTLEISRGTTGWTEGRNEVIPLLGRSMVSFGLVEHSNLSSRPV